MTDRKIVASMQKALVDYDDALERFRMTEGAVSRARTDQANAQIALDKAAAALAKECENNGVAQIILKAKAAEEAKSRMVIES